MFYLLHVVLDTSPAQLDLHEQQVILLPRPIQCHAMLVVRKLLVTLHLFQSFLSVTFAPKNLLRLLDCVEFSVIATTHLEHLAEASLTQLTDRLKALLEVRFILVFVVEAAF